MKRWLVVLIGVLGASFAAWSQGAGDQFFSAPVVHDINITFYQPDYYDTLVANKAYDELTGINLYIPATVTINGENLDSVGVRFRGNSSYGHPGTKKPLKLDFNEYIDTLRYDGLKKLNLSNGFLDPSMMREKLMLDMMNDQGMFAPRCTYARVSFNGEFVGLYKAIEQIDKTYLKRHFGNKGGNLYKGEPHAPLVWEGSDQSAYYDNMELKTNELVNDWSQLIAFKDVVNHIPDAALVTELEQKFNTTAFIRSWAANNLFGNLDSYMYLPHNYYLYENTDTEKIEWITWDVSLAFGVYAILIVPESENFDLLFLPNNAATERPLTYRLLNSNFYKKQYLEVICELLQEDFSTDKLFPKIDSIAAVIRPHLEDEPQANRMFSLEEFDRNVAFGTVQYELIGRVPGLKDFVYQRRKNVVKQLCDYGYSCATNDYYDDDAPMMNVYPNPSADGLVHIEFQVPEEGGPVDYLLTDIYGRKVWSDAILPEQDGSPTQLQLLLPQGVYVLQTDGNCRQDVRKIMVKN